MNQSQFNNYWLKRIAAREKGYYRDADNLIKILRKEYARNFNALQKELAYLYETSLTNAKGEVLYKAKYVAQLMKDIDPKLAAQFLKQNKEMAKILGEVYENEFYHTVFDLGKSGMQFSFTPLDSRAVRKVLTYPWSGAEFSERIWDNKDVLIHNLKQTLTQGLIQGQDYGKMTDFLADKMDASLSRTATLVKTETAFVQNQAHKDTYKEAGIKKYRYLATLDDRTSEVCQDLDGREFRLDEASVGVNYPPMHPNCRSVTVAVIGEVTGTRTAKEDGEWVEVPAGMSYKQWREKVK